MQMCTDVYYLLQNACRYFNKTLSKIKEFQEFRIHYNFYEFLKEEKLFSHSINFNI